MSLFARKKAPAGALSPSTVLLRGTSSFSKTQQLYQNHITAQTHKCKLAPGPGHACAGEWKAACNEKEH